MSSRFESLIVASNLASESQSQSASEPPSPASSSKPEPTLKPWPFYFYQDWSLEKDTSPPNKKHQNASCFPMKMHAILSSPDLTDVVSWCDHGRSFRVLRPKEFEKSVIPKFFEHTKFSSFIRQANGWGFRRVIQGRDRGSYYHELFLRGMPHLAKKMKRPGKAMKITIDSDHEPDLYKISEMFPLPDSPQCEPKKMTEMLERRASGLSVTTSDKETGIPTGIVAPKPIRSPSLSLPTAGSAFVKPQQQRLETLQQPSSPSLQAASQGKAPPVTPTARNDLLVSAIRACQNQASQPTSPAAQQPLQPPAAAYSPPSAIASPFSNNPGQVNEVLLRLLTAALSQSQGGLLTSPALAVTPSLVQPTTSNSLLLRRALEEIVLGGSGGGDQTTSSLLRG